MKRDLIDQKFWTIFIRCVLFSKPEDNRKGEIMATVTDFNTWLSEADPEGYEEIYSLYKCIENENDYGIWTCGKNNDMLFIKARHTEDTLILTSKKTKKAFLRLILDYYVEDKEMNIEMWYGYQRSMAKNA